MFPATEGQPCPTTEIYPMEWFRTTANAEKKDDFGLWFGKSVVRDEHGNPLTVYHGSDSPERFEQFQQPEEPRRPGSGYGHWFTTSEDEAREYAQRPGGTGHVYKTHLSIQNPLDLRDPKKQRLNRSMWDVASRKALAEVPHNQEDLGTGGPVVSFDSREDNQMYQALKAQHYRQALLDLGFDGIIQPDEHGTEGEYTYVALHPEQIRMAP